MKVTIECTEKEIADFVLRIQSQPVSESTKEVEIIREPYSSVRKVRVKE